MVQRLQSLWHTVMPESVPPYLTRSLRRPTVMKPHHGSTAMLSSISTSWHMCASIFTPHSLMHLKRCELPSTHRALSAFHSRMIGDRPTSEADAPATTGSTGGENVSSHTSPAFALRYGAVADPRQLDRRPLRHSRRLPAKVTTHSQMRR